MPKVSQEIVAGKVWSGRRRIKWIDAARGIGIILVVFGHVLRGAVDAGLMTRSNTLWLLEYGIYTFHMPLFFALAGLNVKRSIEKGKERFFIDKLWTIAYPYLLWSAIQGGIQLALPGMVNRQRSAMFLTTILWKPIAQFWFLYALFLCHMAALIVRQRSWLLAFVGVAAYGLNLAGIGQPTTYVLGFYVAGIFLSDALNRWTPGLKLCAIEVLGFGVLFAMAEHFGRITSGAVPSSIFSLPASVLGIALVCALGQVAASTGGWISGILTGLGVMSMTIYILHVLAATSARIALKRLRLTGMPEELVIGTLAGVGLPVVAHLVFERLSILTTLGLAPLRWGGQGSQVVPTTSLDRAEVGSTKVAEL
jgi:fucose 4-O-acetylase-like acetyltransferase